MGILSGLGGLGLGGLEGVDIFAKEEKEVVVPEKKVVKAPEYVESDYIYDREVTCPVCGKQYKTKTVKNAKARQIGMDADLRPKFEGVDPIKYDVMLCTRCGYATNTRFFTTLIPAKVKMIRENVCKNIKLAYRYDGETYSYEEALERFKVALACSVVKRSSNGEKAYVCLRTAWVLRGYQEELEGQDPVQNAEKIASLKLQEEEYLKNAYTGFLDARQNEVPPVCGMDSVTLDYLLAQLAFRLEDYENSAKLVQSILASSSANSRIKDRTLDLKNQILAIRKKS